MIASAHVDSFTRDNLPPRAQWPDFLFDLPELAYPERMNCVAELLDRHLADGRGARPCLITDQATISYAGLAREVNRVANVITRDLGMVPGNRVLLRGPNSPAMVAAYLAVLKAGGVVVATMPLLRAKEIAFPIVKARISLALCDHRLAEEMEKARAQLAEPVRVVYWGSGGAEALETLAARPGYEHFRACDTASDDVCLIGFTSGTTGEPKGTMHFHRDLLATCDSYGRHVLRAQESDRFIGSPPLAFTFGLGGLVLFPLHAGAATVLPERTAPEDLLAAIERHRASVCFTAPTAYRAMLARLPEHDVTSLRKCVSAGEALPKATFEAWQAATGLRSWTASAPPRCCTSSSARPRRRSAPAPPAGRCPATRRAWSMHRGASLPPAPTAAWRCAGPPAAAISPTPASSTTCRTAGTSPVTPIAWMPTATSGTRRAPTT
jgi:2-aminobenzoate-CoA ligase